MNPKLRASYIWPGGVFGGQGLLWLVSLFVARLLAKILAKHMPIAAVIVREAT